MTAENHLYGVPIFLWEYYGYVFLWVQMLASYRDDQFFFPMAIATRKSAFYFQTYSEFYGMNTGLEIFKQRMRLAKQLSNCTKHQIYILTVKLVVSSALDISTHSVKKREKLVELSSELNLLKLLGICPFVLTRVGAVCKNQQIVLHLAVFLAVFCTP